jgi:hypothetical protein
MKIQLQEITKMENGTLTFDRSTILTGMGLGARGDQENHFLTIDYKSYAITVDAKIGVQSYCRVSCDVPTKKGNADFEVESRSHLLILFSRNKARLDINKPILNFVTFWNQIHPGNP